MRQFRHSIAGGSIFGQAGLRVNEYLEVLLEVSLEIFVHYFCSLPTNVVVCYIETCVEVSFVFAGRWLVPRRRAVALARSF
jgi:hypothetical protein